MNIQRVFVSAHQTELRDERFAVKGIINDTAMFRDMFHVFLFEDISAQGKSPVTTYLRYVASSDIYIGIIGDMYGKKGADGMCATEREFRHFLKENPRGEVLIFVKGRDDSSKDADTKRFLEHIKQSFIYRRFTNPDNLQTQVVKSLISYLDTKGVIARSPFDERLCLDAKYTDIDEKEVKNFLENRAIKLNVNIPKIPIKDFLIKTLNVIKEKDGEMMPTNTAIVFFGKDPSRLISHHEIRIARFKGNDRIAFIDSREIRGTIYKMLDEVEQFFVRNTRLASKIVGFKRVDIPEYPYEAIREAVINALAHRDYTVTGAPIIISIFDNRVEVSNPGALLPGISIKDIEGHHKTRNKKICDIFHETKDMEKFGTGIKKMKQLMKEHGLPYPTFKEEGDFFVARFYGPGDAILDLVPDVPKERHIDLREVGLNDRQIEALRLMVNGKKQMTIKKYVSLFDVSDKTAKRDMGSLLRKSFIVKTGYKKGAYFKAK